jgi:hypothetical protein
VLCEDGDYPQNFIRGLTPSGEIVDFALNLVKKGESEFAGAIYSPDGKWLIVHIRCRASRSPSPVRGATACSRHASDSGRNRDRLGDPTAVPNRAQSVP